MKRDADHFGDRELELVYIGKRLKECLRAEDILTAAEIDYAVEVENYLGGFLFKRERAGAFIYVLPESADQARKALINLSGYVAQT